MYPIHKVITYNLYLITILKTISTFLGHPSRGFLAATYERTGRGAIDPRHFPREESLTGWKTYRGDGFFAWGPQAPNKNERWEPPKMWRFGQMISLEKKHGWSSWSMLDFRMLPWCTAKMMRRWIETGWKKTVFRCVSYHRLISEWSAKVEFPTNNHTPSRNQLKNTSAQKKINMDTKNVCLEWNIYIHILKHG